jgi:hypothetical protein
MTREDFIKEYCEKSKITPLILLKDNVVLPCGCGDEKCKGWAVVANNETALKAHFDLYAPQQPKGLTAQEKKNMDANIFAAIKKLTEDKSPLNAVMYIRGDAEFDHATICIEGDAKLLAMTLIHHIEQNPGFNQFITAVVGSYLSKNKEEYDKFLAGIEIMKHTVGQN